MALLKFNSPSTILSIPKLFVNSYTVNFGCIPDVLTAPYTTFAASPLSGAGVQDEISIKQFFKDISNQYNLSSCVANATADACESQIARRLNTSPANVPDLSRLFIYWNARNLMNPPATNNDNGTQIYLAFDSIMRYGVPNELTWSYDTSKVAVKPNWLSYREAIQNKIKAYYRIEATGNDRVLQCIKALYSGCPVVFGTSVAKSFLSAGSGVVNLPSDSFIGKHAMIITGWSASKQAFEVRNSWGTTFGVNGYCWMHKDYIAETITRDLWVPTV
jgi:C1A family cysteine protease